MKNYAVLILVLEFVVGLFPATSLAAGDNTHEGRTIYLKHCQVCHGTEGKGDGYTHFNPPVGDLTKASIQRKSDKKLWGSIHMGVPNTAMGMWRFVLSDEEIDFVLEYVRSLTR